jgi:hypothetical protein
MAETTSELIAELNTLLDSAQPLVGKIAMNTMLQKVLNSVVNLRIGSWQQPVLGLQNAPPGSPSSGDRYVVGAAPAGAWDGNDSAIAEWDGTAEEWVFSPMLNGAMVCNSSLPTIAYLKSGGVFRTVRVAKASFAGMTSSVSTTSSTLQAIPALKADVKAGGRYRVEIRLLMKSDTAAQGVRIGLTGPSADSVTWSAHIPQASNSEQVQHGTAYNTPAISSAVPAAGQLFIARLDAMVLNPGADGMVQAMVASGDGVAEITVLDGSMIEATEISA